MPRKRLLALFGSLVLVAVGCGGATVSPTPPPTGCPTSIPGANGSPSPLVSPCLILATELPTLSPTPSASGSLEGWVGQAEIDSAAVYPNNDTCRDGWTLVFHFEVDAAGTVRGRGTADLTSPPVCPFMIGVDPAALSWRHIEYTVTGHRSATDVELTFTLGPYEPAGGASMAGLAAMFPGPPAPRGAPVTIPTAAGHGQGPVKWQFASGNPPATYSATGMMTVLCGACR